MKKRTIYAENEKTIEQLDEDKLFYIIFKWFHHLSTGPGLAQHPILGIPPTRRYPYRRLSVCLVNRYPQIQGQPFNIPGKFYIDFVLNPSHLFI